MRCALTIHTYDITDTEALRQVCQCDLYTNNINGLLCYDGSYMTQQRFVVRSDVSAPNGRSKGYSDALRQLKPGESVLLPIKVATARSLMNKLYLRGQFARHSFRARAEGDEARVWRVL